MDQMNESAAVILRGCGHVFCQVCIARVAEGYHSDCPFCRKSFQPEDMIKWNAAEAASATGKESTKEPTLSEKMDELGPSPKMEALLLAIGEMKGGEKGVIFSQFTKFLDEIEKFLESNNLTFSRIDGSKSATQRSEAMRSFAEEESGPQFMLCSLHAAGTVVLVAGKQDRQDIGSVAARRIGDIQVFRAIVMAPALVDHFFLFDGRWLGSQKRA